MLLNQLDEVQALLERMGEAPEVLAIRVYDKKGKVVLSSLPEEIGYEVLLEETPCLDCHGPGAHVTDAADESSSMLRTANGERAARHLSVLPNESVCATAACHAHPPEKTVLGVLDIEMSLAPVEAAMRSARRQLVATTVILLLITAAVVWILVRRLVQHPVSRLEEGTQRVAAGDLATRIEVPGADQGGEVFGERLIAGDLGRHGLPAAPDHERQSHAVEKARTRGLPTRRPQGR